MINAYLILNNIHKLPYRFQSAFVIYGINRAAKLKTKKAVMEAYNILDYSSAIVHDTFRIPFESMETVVNIYCDMQDIKTNKLKKHKEIVQRELSVHRRASHLWAGGQQ